MMKITKKTLSTVIASIVVSSTIVGNCRPAYASTTINVDPAAQYQTFDGWGTSLCWWTDATGDWSEPKRNELMDLLYDQNTGIGLNIARYNIGGGENPDHNHMRKGGAIPGYMPEPGVWDWNADAKQRWALQAAKQRGANRFEAFSNSPPYWMTYSGCTAGNTQWGTYPFSKVAQICGVNNLKTDQFEGFSDYLTEVVKHFKDNWGIEFETLSPINEPLSPAWQYENVQEGCHWDWDRQNRIMKEVGKKLKAKNLNTTISGPEENAIEETCYSMQQYDDEAKSYISRINTHSYSEKSPIYLPWTNIGWKLYSARIADSNANYRTSMKNIAAHEDKKLWMSEYGCGGDWRVKGTHDHDEMKWALTLSDTITKDLNDMQAQGWVYWQAVEGEEGCVQGNHGWGLIHASFEPGKEEYWKTKQYYALGNYSKFIKPGYKIIGTGNANTVAAYDEKSGKLVLVVTNNSSNAVSYTYNLSGFNKVGSNASVYCTSDNDALSKLESIPVNQKSFTTNLKPNSVTTYVIDGVSYDNKVINVNDSQIGTGVNKIKYNGSWQFCNQDGAYSNDNHWSNNRDDSYEVKFYGTQVKIYGAQDRSHGIAEISIDGKVQKEYDCYSSKRKEDNLMYTSAVLPQGEHTLKVRVTGKKGTWSTGTSIPVDRIQVINDPEKVYDVAVGKPASASSEESNKGNGTYNGNDGNDSTYWCASNGNWGHWWKVDLGDLHNLTGSQIKWGRDGVVYKYKIEVSSDDVNWKVALDNTSNTKKTQIQDENFNAENVRYVRITINETTDSAWCSFYDFKVFGNKIQNK